MKNDYLNTFEEGDMLIREDFDLEFDNQRMLFPIEVWFDADKKFGVNTKDHDGAWVNIKRGYIYFETPSSFLGILMWEFTTRK